MAAEATAAMESCESEFLRIPIAVAATDDDDDDLVPMNQKDMIDISWMAEEEERQEISRMKDLKFSNYWRQSFHFYVL